MRPVKIIQTTVPTAVLHAMIVALIQKQPWKGRSNAINVLLAVPPKRAAPNVPIAHRANLNTLSTTKKFAPTAPLALHKVTRTKKVVRNVFKEKKHQHAEVVFVQLAIWVNST